MQFFLFLFADAQNLTLKVSGSEKEGYVTDIYYKGVKQTNNHEEFAIQLFNNDLSTEIDLPNWRGKSWAGNFDSITLSGETYVRDLDAYLRVRVDYKVVNEAVVKKTIRLFQPSMPRMYYIIRQTYRPAFAPVKTVSFEYDDFPGGLVHEMYPAVGMVSPDNHVVGFLTDAGYLNQFTRNTRRRYSGRGGGFVGMRKLPDPKLFYVSDAKDKNDPYVQQTFGEMYDIDAAPSLYTTTVPAVYQKVGNPSVQRNGEQLHISNTASGKSGIEWIAPLKEQQVYTIQFDCKGNAPLVLKLYRIKNGSKTQELEYGVKYIDNFPTQTSEWSSFKGSIFIPYIQGDSVSLFIGTNGKQASDLLLRDFKIIEHKPASRPYNFLAMGDTTQKTSYIFVEPWKDHHQFTLSSQTRLAEGKGFQGSMFEKMTYANFNMLTWVTDVDDMAPLNVPNMNYAPDMYNRDCFFSTVSTYNKKLNIALWEKWGKTQLKNGGIGTIVSPLMGSIEVKDNEATLEWLMWALLNKRRFGMELPKDKIDRAIKYVLHAIDSTGSGICYAGNPLNQLDIVDFKPKTDRMAVNQGMLAVVLRVMKELGYNISDAHIQNAEEAYRRFYDKDRKHFLFDKKFPDVISPSDLEPEFFSIWLFNKKLLTDEMVVNQLEQLPRLNPNKNAPHPEMGTCVPVCIWLTKDGKGYTYFDKQHNPFGQFGEDNYADGTNDGFYYNGGSWFRTEYMAYVVGLKHGWGKAKAAMENRVWAEINLHPDWCFSKEFIPTKWNDYQQWWMSTRGLCWNVFVLVADEVAGLRTPSMDPDKNSTLR